MNQTEIIALFDDGVNTTYGWYDQGNEPKRPYRILNYLNSDDLNADDTRYFPCDRWQLDLITDKRNLSLEKSTEDALLARGIIFSKQQDADAADHRIRMIYRFKTLGE